MTTQIRWWMLFLFWSCTWYNFILYLFWYFFCHFSHALFAFIFHSLLLVLLCVCVFEFVIHSFFVHVQQMIFISMLFYIGFLSLSLSRSLDMWCVSSICYLLHSFYPFVESFCHFHLQQCQPHRGEKEKQCDPINFIRIYMYFILKPYRWLSILSKETTTV